MINQSPILIAAPPRSGTTMLAGLLHYHGIWVGNAKTTDYPGSNSNFGSENIDIKNLMKREAAKVGYRNWRVPLPYWQNSDYEILKSEIEKFIPKKTRWLVKTSWTLAFVDFWRSAYPKALWLLPTRFEKEILDSMNRHPSMAHHPDNMKIKFIRALVKRQHEVDNTVKNKLWVGIKKVANRDKEMIERIFEYLEIKPNWKIIESWIKPKMMK